MTTIIVEDGTGLPDANSYASVAEARSYADDRGVAVPSSNDEVARLLIRATDYVDSREPRFIGVRQFLTQALAWPRLSDCGRTELGVPAGIIKAQLIAFLALAQGADLSPIVTASSLVTKKKVGDIEVTYQASEGLSASGALIPLFESTIYPFCVGIRQIGVSRG